MRTSAILIIRTSVILGVLIAMPLAAIPRVNGRLNRLVRAEASVDGREVAQLDRAAASGPVGGASFGPQAVQRQREPIQDRLLRLRDQLERLGADYMILESGAPEQRSYRFYCRVRIPRSRGFEATDPDPGRAMERVLEEVQTWRLATDANGLPAATIHR